MCTGSHFLVFNNDANTTVIAYTAVTMDKSL